MIIIKNIADAIAKAHMLTHEAKLEMFAINENQTSYMAIVTHPMLTSNIEEVISVHNMPSDIAEEYVHCRVHGLAAKLLAKLHPEKP